jgi:hypothetical protein
MKGFNCIQEQTDTLTAFGKVNISLRLLRAAYDVKRTKLQTKKSGGKITKRYGI